MPLQEARSRSILIGQEHRSLNVAVTGGIQPPVGLLGGADHPLHVVTERSIDLRLVSAPTGSAGLEPGDDVRVQTQRNLLL